MKTILRPAFLALGVFSMLAVSAQRYLNEVFSASDVVVTQNVDYGTNVDWLTSDFTTTPPTINTVTKRMDIYEPAQGADTLSERPMIVYLHTGNALPPPFNGSPNGSKADSSVIVTCTQWAMRGYVAVAVNMRHGWDPLNPNPQIRRGTLLNAIYRQVHDVKQAVRTLKEDADNANTYGIDVNKIVVYGEGTGGYVAQAYTTLDKPEELFIEKFRPNPFEPDTSYVDTTLVGNLDGFGGDLNFYIDNGYDSEVHMSVNAGGSLADSSWLEMGDVPMVSFHCIRDDFAPFTNGDVIVPTTQEIVVEVQGSNYFQQKANDLGNNDSFINLPSDPFTDRARAMYGTTWDVSNGGTETVNLTPEGLFPVLRPLGAFLSNEASPWQWWDPNGALAMAEVAPGVTAHMASLASNPDMSPMKGRAYIDTIQGYMHPRVVCALGLLPGYDCGSAGFVNLSPNMEGFEGADFPSPCWGNLDQDNDGEFWFRDGAPGVSPHNGDSCALSASWFNNQVLTPENYLITPQLTPGIDENLTYWIAAQDPLYPAEKYAVVVSTTGTAAADFTDEVFVEILTSADWEERNVDLSAYVGMDIYIAFKHYDVSNEFWIKLDDIQYPSHTEECTIGIGEEVVNYNVSIYPNPSSSDVNFISNEEMIQSLDIVDIAGRNIRTVEVNSNQYKLDRNDLSNGVYFVNMHFEAGSMTRKLILK